MFAGSDNVAALVYSWIPGFLRNPARLDEKNRRPPRWSNCRVCRREWRISGRSRHRLPDASTELRPRGREFPRQAKGGGSRPPDGGLEGSDVRNSGRPPLRGAFRSSTLGPGGGRRTL
jgi:hypothetical protein